MAKEPRAHHFVPQFYLAGFTASGSRESRLTVLGLGKQAGREWSATPADIGHERDFYRDDSSVDDPTWFERDLLGGFEGATGALLQRLNAAPVLPTANTDDWRLLMNFAALMWARGPVIRETLSQPLIQTAKVIMSMLASSRERYERAVAAAKASGDIDPSLDVDYETARAGIEGNEFRISVSRPYMLRTILTTVSTVTPLLAARRWMLLLNDNPDISFLVSDHPVAVTFTTPRPHTVYNVPAFGVRGTDVTMPLTKSLALLGRFEQGEPYTWRADRNTVAAVNAKTLDYAQRFIAGPSKEAFAFPAATGEIVGYDELRRTLATTNDEDSGNADSEEWHSHDCCDLRPEEH